MSGLNDDRRRGRPAQPDPPPRPAGEADRARGHHARRRVHAAAALAGVRGLRGALIASPRSRASARATIWARARVVLPLVLFVAVFVPFVRDGDPVDLGPVTVSEQGLATFATVSAKAILGTCERGPARRDHELPRRPARARAAARAAAARPDRRVHVPLPVRDRRRGRADARRARRPRLRAPARAAGGRDRPRRHRAVPAHATSAPSACTWRCSRAASRRDAAPATSSRSARATRLPRRARRRRCCRSG